MDLFYLLIFTVAISVSGALAPGPLTISAIAVGVKKGLKGGFLVAVGHSLFELPYVLAIALFSVAISDFIKGNVMLSYLLIVIIVSFILYFSYLIINDGVRTLKHGQMPITDKRGLFMLNPIIVGITLTGLNPFFLLWWLSIGMPLIQLSLVMGLIGVFLMYLFHVWMDYAWLTLMGAAGRGGAKILGSKGYGILLIVLGFILIVFALNLVFRIYL